MEKEKLIEEFSSIKGIDNEIALKLYNAGIKSIDDLETQDPQQLAEIIGFPAKTIEQWINAASDMIKKKEVEKSEEVILTLKDFLKCSYENAKHLRNMGVFSIEDLANEDPKQLADDTEINLRYIKLWINRAKKEIRDKKTFKKDENKGPQIKKP
ncbi:MAG: helix-hairpin-helix domain-containing protein [Promethearchaeota archaeon]